MVEREWFDKDYYKVLGLTSSATDKEITRAYRKLAKSSHPDTNPGSEEKFKEVSVAYDVLGDKEKRKEYDEVRRLGPAAAGFGGPGGGPGAGRLQLPDRRLRRPGRPLRRALRWWTPPTRPTRRGPRDGAAPGFRDAVMGVTTSVNLPSNEACHTCKGSGAAPGTGFVTCERCGVAAYSTTTRDRSRCRASARSVRVAAGES
jgi:molecular chaperone DnaJ